jgi:hypothetical protein
MARLSCSPRPSRRLRSFSRFLVLGGLSAAIGTGASCRFGEARFESTFEGVGFDPGGTVFSYVDGHDDLLVPDGNPRVVVVMTWIVFDPTRDLNDVDGSELADMAHEMRLRDALSLTFDEQGAVDPGEEFTSVVVGDEETDDGGMTARVYLAPERLDASSSYEDFEPFASERHTKVSVADADFDEGSGVIAGDVEIVFEADDADPGTAREGTLTGTFRAPLVEERVAEQNLGLLAAADVLGVPPSDDEGGEGEGEGE